MSYEAFLRGKSQAGADAGFKPLWMPDFLFDFQAEKVEWAIRKGRAANVADCGLGKARPVSEIVLTDRGWRAIGGLVPGDSVYAADGSLTAVEAVFPQGERSIYEVTFDDGAKTRCDAEHLWTVRSDNDASRGKPWRNMTLAEIMETGLLAAKTRQTLNWRIPVCAAIEAAPVEFPVHPYVLGVLLGDGSFRGKFSVSFTSADPEVAAMVDAVLPDYLRVTRDAEEVRTPEYRIAGKSGTPNPVTAALRTAGLWDKYSHEKWVPPEYMHGSVGQRLELLRGLMDTDGYVSREGTIQFSSSSRQLADDVVTITRSLGGIAYVADKLPTFTHLGERRTGLPHWIVTLTLPDGVVPFALQRKVNRCRAKSRCQPIRKIESIRQVKNEEAVCIRVAHPSMLYITREYVVTHNTPMALVLGSNCARKTNKPTLYFNPCAVGPQIVREAEKFGIEARLSRDGQVRAGDHIVVTNYEKEHLFNPNDFGAVICGESSILKSFDGAIRGAMTQFMRKVEYRLLETATAAPNDYTELGTSSEALGYLGHMDMLNRFFKNDLNNSAQGRMRGEVIKWRLKGHAETPFWRWVCSWMHAIRKPSDMGYSDEAFILPELQEVEHLVRSNKLAEGFLFELPAVGLKEQREERRRTVGERCERVASLVNPTGQPALVWCDLNEEGDTLAKMIPDAVQVSGADSDEAKEEKLMSFVDGKTRVLVTKKKIGAWGLNFQHCAHIVDFPSHSFEQRYQGIRRCWRFGQKRAVRVDTVTTEGQQGIVKNMQRKAAQADAMFDRLVRHMNDSQGVERFNAHTNHMEAPAWLSPISA